MFGFLFGTVCLIALVKLVRGRWGHGYGRLGYGGCHGGSQGWGRHGGDPGWGPGWGSGSGGRTGGRGFFLRSLFERLETTPGQERVIAGAIDDLRTAAKNVRDPAKGLNDLASALRAESFDESAAAKFSVEAEEAFGTLRTAALDALRKVHEALDDRQRKMLADWIERRRFGGFGPFRNGGSQVWM
jgi:Spy/CpxP family protein refolding chaperone